MENGRNICAESGCPGVCCRDIFMIDRRSRVTSSFNEATEFPSGEMPELHDLGPGVYFCNYTSPDIPDGVFALIEGCCPNLNSTGECTIHDSAMRPNACANFKPGSAECNKIREEEGLPEFKEPVTTVS